MLLHQFFEKRLLRVAGIVGFATESADTIELAYDVLGLEALFLVPRICSLLSLNPYFGTLVSYSTLHHPSLAPSASIASRFRWTMPYSWPRFS